MKSYNITKVMILLYNSQKYNKKDLKCFNKKKHLKIMPENYIHHQCYNSFLCFT